MFDFDNTTGLVSNPITLSNSYPGLGPYGVEFSSLSQFVYISVTEPLISTYIYQYDLTNPGIPASVTTIGNILGYMDAGIGMQLASNGKIYIANYFNDSLYVINNPDSIGLSSGFANSGIDLSPGFSILGLPSIMQSYLRQPTILHNDTCNGDTTTTTFYTKLFNYDSLKWNFGDIPSGVLNTSTLNAPVHYYSLPGTYTVQLIMYRSAIADTSYKDIIIYPLTNATITSVGALCLNDDSITLTAIDMGGMWLGNGVTDTLTGVFNPMLADSGLHQIIYTTPGNCGESDTIQVQVNPIVDSLRTDTICKGDSLFIYGEWQAIAGIYYDSLNTFLGCDSLMITELYINPSYNNIDTLYVCQGDSVYLAGQFQTSTGFYVENSVTVLGCDSITNTQFYVIPTPLAPIVTDTVTCFNDGIPNLFAQKQGSGSIEWYSDSQLLNLLSIGSSYNPTINNAGNYFYYIVENNRNCYGDTSVILLTVYKPEADISPSDVEGNNPLEVIFQNNSNNASSYLWNFGTGDTTSLDIPTYVFEEVGNYTVSLTASDTNGCFDITTIEIIVLTEALVEIPTVFTPNRDGFNDIFSVNAKGIIEMSATIFNRWGQEVWRMQELKSIKDISLHNYPIWDGRTSSGIETSVGTYYYVLNYVSIYDEPNVKKGAITLLR